MDILHHLLIRQICLPDRNEIRPACAGAAVIPPSQHLPPKRVCGTIAGVVYHCTVSPLF
jgi:hypothetical protein